MLIQNNAYATDERLVALENLDYVKKFLNVAPERSRTRLLSSKDSLEKLTAHEKITWHKSGATIGLKLNDLKLFSSSLIALTNLISKENLYKHQLSTLALLGHYNLKSNYIDKAKSAYFCVFFLSKNEQEKIKAAYRISNAYLSENQIDQAELIMTKLLNIATQQNKLAWFGPIKSTMGIYALHRNEYLNAEKLFKESINAHQSIQNYSGEFNSGLNLLLTFALNNNPNYERINYRVTMLAKKNNDMDRALLLQLIKLVKSASESNNYDKYQKEAIQHYNNVQSSTVKAAARNFIFPSLKVKHDIPDLKPAPQWVDSAMSRLKCNDNEQSLNLVLNELEDIERDKKFNK